MYFYSRVVKAFALPRLAVASSRVPAEENSVCQDRVCQSFVFGKLPLVSVYLSDGRSDSHLMGGLRGFKSGVKAPVFSTRGFFHVSVLHTYLPFFSLFVEKNNYSMQRRGNNVNPK